MAIELGGIQQFGVQNLEDIAARISREPTMLATTGQALHETYEQGRAILMMDEEQIVGIIKFSELLGPPLKEKLGIPSGIPDIWEIGSGIIVPEYRGRNLYKGLRGALLESQLTRMNQGELLILGTTKSLRVLHSLHESQSLGIQFFPSNHQEFPMVAPFTCVCNPEMGTGYHHNTDGCFNCASRISITEISRYRDINNIPFSYNGQGDKVPCTMYVSSRELAEKTNAELLDLYKGYPDPVATLVQQLRQGDINYYEE